MLVPISEDKFVRSDPMFRVIVHDDSRKFGSLQLPQASHEITLSWRSDGIEPVIEIDSSSSIWVGIDQRVACLSSHGRVLFSMGLHGNLFMIKCFETCTVVLSDIEYIAVNKDYSLRQIDHLSAIPHSVEMQNDHVIVTSVNGEQQAF